MGPRKLKMKKVGEVAPKVKVDSPTTVIGEVFLSFRDSICSVYVAYSRRVEVRPRVTARISFV